MKHISRFVLIVSTLIAWGGSVSYSQSTYLVKGTVTASGTPVRYASVTFFDSYDFSIQYAAVTDSTGAFSLGSITEVKGKSQLPTKFKLDQNYPNPFSSSTAISYDLNGQSEAKVTIYDVLGREVRTFDAGYEGAGPHGIVWNGRNNVGNLVAPGVYFYRLQANGQAQVKKMVFVPGGNARSFLLPGTASLSAKMSPDAFQGPPVKPLSRSESFAVVISNTDSTFPTIVGKQIGNVVVQSDTSFAFAVSLPQAMVYLDSTEQIIRGFGGANVFIFGRPDMTPAEVLTAFGNGKEQVGMTIMRVSIPTDSTQFAAYARSALAAQDLGALIIATPWTPPAWMKSNDSEVGGYLLPSNYAAFAGHLKAFADTMAAYGVSLYAISVQNEPDFSPDYQSCLWSASQFVAFMRDYAPLVGVPVFIPESATFSHTLSDASLNDSLAASHIAFVGGHIYGVQPSSYPLALSKGKELWMTEYLINGAGLDSSWTGALQTAKSINDCMMSNMSAYVWWYIVRYYGPVDEYGNVTKKGYAMSQFGRFVRPGFFRVSATATPVSNVYLTAYRDGSKVVVVAVNMGSGPATFPVILQGGTAGSFTPYVTSAAKNCVQGNDVPVSNGGFTATLDPSSVTTFVSN